MLSLAPAASVSTVQPLCKLSVAAAAATTLNLHNGWTVETLAAGASDNIFGDGDALSLLLAGVLLSALLGALIYVLGTSRGRAMQLVHERTDQLRFQTLHDSLTCLLYTSPSPRDRQ